MLLSEKTGPKSLVKQSRRGAILTIGALAALPLLSACGFTPLHAKRGSDGNSVNDRLASVGIDPLSDRNGQMLHNFLRDRINPHGQPGDPEYILRVDLRESTQELALRKDETARRANLIVRARFALYDKSGRNVIYRGNSQATSGYSILALEEEYGTLVAERDARRRALTVVADEISQRLAVFLSRDEG